MRKFIYNNNGFTFIELIIYFVIILILDSSVLISIKSLERQKLIQNAISLQTNLRYCQRVAINSKIKHGIFIDEENNLYYINLIDDNNKLIKKENIYLSPGIKISTNAKNKKINYTQEGTTGNACTITLKAKDYFLNLTVNVGCGRVKINGIQKLV
jgi:Tfp pilus assembly protein FimT